MRGQEPSGGDGTSSLRRGHHAGAEDADSLPPGVGGETETAPASPPETRPQFEDWLLGVASWYVSREGSRAATDKTPATASP